MQWTRDSEAEATTADFDVTAVCESVYFTRPMRTTKGGDGRAGRVAAPSGRP